MRARTVVAMTIAWKNRSGARELADTSWLPSPWDEVALNTIAGMLEAVEATSGALREIGRQKTYPNPRAAGMAEGIIATRQSYLESLATLLAAADPASRTWAENYAGFVLENLEEIAQQGAVGTIALVAHPMVWTGLALKGNRPDGEEDSERLRIVTPGGGNIVEVNILTSTDVDKILGHTKTADFLSGFFDLRIPPVRLGNRELVAYTKLRGLGISIGEAVRTAQEITAPEAPTRKAGSATFSM